MKTKTITPDRAALQFMVQALEEFRKLDEVMPVQMIATWLQIALEEGLSQRELEQRVGLSQASISRNVTTLSGASALRPGAVGHGVVDVDVDPNDNRKRVLTLTTKGKRVRDTLATIWTRYCG